MPIKQASLSIKNKSIDEVSIKPKSNKSKAKNDVKDKCVQLHNFDMNKYPNIKQFCSPILKDIQNRQESSQGRIRFIEKPIAESTYTNKHHEKARVFKEIRNIELNPEHKQKIENELIEASKSIGSMSKALIDIETRLQKAINIIPNSMNFEHIITGSALFPHPPTELDDKPNIPLKELEKKWNEVINSNKQNKAINEERNNIYNNSPVYLEHRKAHEAHIGSRVRIKDKKNSKPNSSGSVKNNNFNTNSNIFIEKREISKLPSTNLKKSIIPQNSVYDSGRNDARKEFNKSQRELLINKQPADAMQINIIEYANNLVYRKLVNSEDKAQNNMLEASLNSFNHMVKETDNIKFAKNNPWETKDKKVEITSVEITKVEKFELAIAKFISTNLDKPIMISDIKNYINKYNLEVPSALLYLQGELTTEDFTKPFYAHPKAETSEKA